MPLLCPILHGPIYPSSTSIEVTGVLGSAKDIGKVELYTTDDNKKVGSGTTTKPGRVWVPLSESLNVNQDVVAVQFFKNEKSESLPIKVIDLPDPLPAPVFVSPLSDCMTCLLLDGLVSGATVTIYQDDIVTANTKVSRPQEWIGLDPSVKLIKGKQLEAFQEIDGITKSSVKSMPIDSVYDLMKGQEVLPKPNIKQPHGCETFLEFYGMIPSADVYADNEGQKVEWTNIGEAYTGTDGPPLIEGELSAKQSFPRCKKESKEINIKVIPPEPPEKPVIDHGICPSGWIHVSKLTPGAILSIHSQYSSSNGPIFTGTFLAGISRESEDFPLPSTFSPVGPNNEPCTLIARQSLCETLSPSSDPVHYVKPGRPYTPPEIYGDLYECARYVRIYAHPGSLVQIISIKKKLPLSDPVVALGTNTTLKLWSPLVAGDVLVVEQKGCNEDGRSKEKTVAKLPDKLPNPKVLKPIRPASPSVKVDGCLPGARIHLFINRSVRTSIDAIVDMYYKSPLVVPVGTPPLAENDEVWAVQTLCSKASSFEPMHVTVNKGKMKLKVEPDTVERGKSTDVTVTARDADTNELITNGKVLLDGNNVGLTGQPFKFSPALGQYPSNSVEGTVKEPIAYYDEQFKIVLTNPPTPTPSPTPTPPSRGVSKVSIWNCTPEYRFIYIWVFDKTAGTGWKQMGCLEPQYSDEYLFDWNENLGNNYSMLKEFLRQNYAIDAVEIEKMDDYNIRVSTAQKEFSIKLNDEKNKAILISEGFGGICPYLGAKPIDIVLDNGHEYIIVGVDTRKLGCHGNIPYDEACLCLYGNFLGNEKGVPWPIIVPSKFPP